ncbi:hypothetical protein ACIBHX_24405 [Nonomuraea sp. NPDC050536]|uniref:hypothetical protein n=1 Tax=Nonomuraea sp. NPDC050536 TaxID=3364366 RepID=UPI0037C7B13D
MVAAGTGLLLLCLVTGADVAPDAAREVFDSPILIPSFLLLAVLAGLAGWQAPRMGFLYGPLAAAPFLVHFVVGVIRNRGDQGLWPIGLIYLIGLTVLPVAAALTTSLIARTRH